MNVLLRRNVRNLGQIGEVVDVKPGYARNYLLPQGLAVQPTKTNVKAVEAEKMKYLEELARLRADLQAKAAVLEGRELNIEARANEEGHLYGSVGPAQIAAILADQGVFVEPRDVAVQPSREVGAYAVVIELGETIRATIKVQVGSDEAIAAAQVARKAGARAERAERVEEPAEEAPAAEKEEPKKPAKEE